MVDPEPPPGTLRRELRSLPRAVWLLCIGQFVNRFGGVVIVFLLLYLRHRGYSPATAGLVVSGYGLGALASGPLGGFLADHSGRRQSIALSMFGSAATMLALSQAPSLALIVPLTVAAGLLSELYRPAASALLADLVPQGRRVPAFALYRLAINVGFAAGPITVGLLAERSFTWVFVVDAATSAGLGVVALVALPETRGPHHQRGPGLRAFPLALRDRRFARFCLASLLSAYVYQQSATTFALHVTDSGLSKAVFGALLSLNGLAVVLLELPIVSRTRNRPPRPVIALGMLLTGIGFGATALASSPLPLALTVLVWTFGEMLSAPVSGAFVADLAPPALRGTYSGLYTLTWSLGYLCATAIAPAIYTLDPNLNWLLSLLLGALAAGLVMRLGRLPVPAGRPLTEPSSS